MLAMTSLCVWPSIVVKRGSTVVLGRTIVKGECKKIFSRTLFKANNVQMTTITKLKSVSFSFLSRPTDPVLLLIFYLQQEIKLEWPNEVTTYCTCTCIFTLCTELYHIVVRLCTSTSLKFFGAQ